MTAVFKQGLMSVWPSPDAPIQWYHGRGSIGRRLLANCDTVSILVILSELKWKGTSQTVDFLFLPGPMNLGISQRWLGRITNPC